MNNTPEEKKCCKKCSKHVLIDVMLEGPTHVFTCSKADCECHVKLVAPQSTLSEECNHSDREKTEGWAKEFINFVELEISYVDGACYQNNERDTRCKDFIAQVEQQAYERGKNKSLDFISGLQTSIFGQQMQIDALLEELKGRNNHSLLSKLREKIDKLERVDGLKDSQYKYIFNDALDRVRELLSELEVKE